MGPINLPTTPTQPPFFKGHVRHPNKDEIIQSSFRRHYRLLRALRAFTAPSSYDLVSLGLVGPIKNQKQCGSCWDFSGTGVVESALIKAGILTTAQPLSEEYTLSCGKNGGCNGDDNVTVLKWAKETGLPLTSDYGSYTASPGRCTWKSGMKLWKIDDFIFCDSNGGNGVTPAADIKANMILHGAIGCAVAAGGSQFWNDGKSKDMGHSRSIDHDVIIVGWDDSKGKVSGSIDPALVGIKASSLTCFKMRNSWDTTWGEDGYAWVEEGADEFGTEAVAAVVQAANLPLDWANM